ncbi:MAG: hypothetical protein H6730_14320 [Deltaproteobacteria bacterium]|nr:hypothetical protein [Deltaproteobacteria bacterium]
MRARYALPLLLAVVGCEQEATETIALEVFPIEVAVEAPEGVDVSGVAVKFNRQDERRTKANGKLRVGYQGAVESKLHVAVNLPADLWTPDPVEKEFVLLHGPDGKPQPIKFVVKAQRRDSDATAYVVVVDTDCGPQAVSLGDEDLGNTDEDGYLSRRIRREPGGTLAVWVKKTSDCPELKCTFALPENGAILNVEPGCDGTTAPTPTPEPERVAEAPPPPPPPTPTPVREERRDPPPTRIAQNTRVERVERVRTPRETPRTRLEVRTPDPEPEPDPEPPPPPPPPPREVRAMVQEPPPPPPPTIVVPDRTPAPVVEDPEPVVVEPEPLARVEPQPAARIEPPPPVERTGPPEGSREVKVTCRPEGVSLYVDGKLALESCKASSTAWMLPGVRKLSVEGNVDGRFCPRSKTQFAEIPSKGRVEALTVSTDCQLACTDFVRDRIKQGQKPTNDEIQCLIELTERKDEFLEGKLLLAHVYQGRGTLDEAERVLMETTETRKGRSDPEVRARLAEILGRRKKLEQASEQAENAWRYRMKFRGSKEKREKWMLTVLKLRAGFFEQLFYDKKDRSYFDRALKTYSDMETAATQVGDVRMARDARASKARLQSQEKQLLE